MIILYKALCTATATATATPTMMKTSKPSKFDVIVMAILFASYVNLFGESPVTPTRVGKALAKVVAVSDARASKDNIREFVVVSPRSGHLHVIRLPLTMPCELDSFGCFDPFRSVNISVPVCYMERSDSDVVDANCGAVGWMTFMLNAFQATGFALLVFCVTVMGAHLVASVRDIVFLSHDDDQAYEKLEAIATMKSFNSNAC